MTTKACSLAGTAVSKWVGIVLKHGLVKERCHVPVLKNPIEKNQGFFNIYHFFNKGCHPRKKKKIKKLKENVRPHPHF